MDEITELALDEPGGELFAAMAYLAALAYPESIAYRDRAIAAMQALMVQAARRHGLKVGPQTMRNQQINGTLRRLDARIAKRIEAAEAASLFSLGVTQGGRRTRIDSMRVKRTREWLLRKGCTLRRADELAATTHIEPGDLLSVNEWAARSNRGDWERDTWRTSRPVLHLALALRGVAYKWRDPRGFRLFPLLANPTWVRDALGSAERHAELLKYAKHPALQHRGARVRLLPA